MADMVRCDRCKIVQESEASDIVKIQMGCYGGGIINEVKPLPFRMDLCKKCRDTIAQCMLSAQ